MTLTSTVINKIGLALAGRYWQADVARAINYSKSQVTRLVGKSRNATEEFSHRLEGAMVAKIEEVADLLKTPGLLTHATEPRVVEIEINAIKKACERLRQMHSECKPSTEGLVGRAPQVLKKKRAA